MQLGLPFATPDQPSPVPELYFVRHRRARRYLLRIDADGRVRVTIPRGGSRREADAFVHRNLPWIHDQRVRLHRTPLDPALTRAVRARAKLELPRLLFEKAGELGLQVAGVAVRNQRSRWGSCSRDGRITLNWRLLLMPDPVRDYVIVHELMHLRRMDHSPAFWAHVAEVCPDYREAVRWLRVNGRSLQ
jgi:predicted metal-dependent hydrolase